MNCQICYSNLVNKWSNRYWQMPDNNRKFCYWICCECGTIFCNPLPMMRELAEYYTNHFDYNWFQEHLRLKKIQASQRWKRTEPFRRKYKLKRGRLLDIGCGHGLFLSSVKESGWTAIGIDYPSIATHYAREKLDLQVIEGDLRTIRFEDHPQISQYDLVTAWHCLEHDREPLSYLKWIVKVLAPNGKILLAVPNAGSLGMKTKHEEWVWCQQPYVHIYHFTQKSISLLAEYAGLRVLEMWTRNTWDANPVFDVYVGEYILKICKLLRCTSYRASFWVEEMARLFCYGVSCYKHWLFGKERKDGLGSELLVLMELRSNKE